MSHPTPLNAVPGAGWNLTGMNATRRMTLPPTTPRPLKGDTLFLDGDRPWCVRRVRVLPDGAVEVFLTR